MLWKNIFDRIFSFLGLVLLFPLFIFIAVMIKIYMPGPIFFKQIRVGKGGGVFVMYKFRSMSVTHSGSSVSVSGESRITNLGKVLRKYKLDELPELWNVLKGEMSFVGPRPDVPGFADNLVGEDRVILKLKPGLTGQASLKYREEEYILSKVSNPIEYNRNIIFPDKVKINLVYYNNWSLYRDFKIIVFSLLSRDFEDYYK